MDREEFQNIISSLSDALAFSRTIGAYERASYETGGGKGVFGEVDFYTRFAHDFLFARRSATDTMLLATKGSC